MNLDKTNIQDMLALSPMQEGMLYLYLQNPRSRDYVETFELRLTGELDIPVLRQAWQRVTAANDALRACFFWKQVKQPLQVILKKHTPEFRVAEGDDGDEPLHFDLSTVPIIMEVKRLDSGDYRLAVHYHHILMDGWSLGILVHELFSHYQDMIRGQAPTMSRKTPMRDYIQYLRSRDAGAHLRFWRDQLVGYEPGARLRTAVQSPCAAGDSKHHEVTAHLEPQVRSGIDTLARQCGTTPAAVFYCAWGLLLHHYCLHEDILFGTTVSGRPPEIPGIERMVGLFINTLPLRLTLAPGDRLTVSDLVNQVGHCLRRREAHETTSLADIGVDFDTIVVVENYPLQEAVPLMRSCGLNPSPPVMREQTHYDLTVGVTLRDSIQLDLLYNDKLFSRRAVERAAGHLLNLLAHMARRPQNMISELDILSPEERSQLLLICNGPSIELPPRETIVSIFWRRAREIPDAIAVVCGELMLSYGELSRQAALLAARIQERGAQAGSLVAVLAERSPAMMVSVLGTLMAGCAYVPLLPSLPAQRIETVLDDCACRIVVTDREWTLPPGTEARSLLMVPSNGFAANETDAQLPPEPRDPEHPAYVIFTSGTTGIPKGVLVPHRAVVNRMIWVRDRYKLGRRDVVLQATAFIFDVSVCELFRWILPGARLCFLAPGAESDPSLILKAVNRFAVTTIDFVPSMVGYLLDWLEQRGDPSGAPALRWVFTGVEKVDTGLVKRFNRVLYRRTGARLINAYGPTESTVDVTCHDCSAIEEEFQGTVPIGAPMANVHIRIVDSVGRLQPMGVAGELCVGGNGLALGYLNRPRLTAQAFDPFYHTGDLALWLEDGTIEFIGRRDRQVKIRGHRVELEEIEQALLAQVGVMEAAVLAFTEEGGEQAVAAYVAAKNHRTFDTDELLGRLSARLPDYMIPAHVTVMAALPRTPAGKVDHEALPIPQAANDLPAAGTPPETEMEKCLADIWRHLLGLESRSPGINDDFFALGGHSLKATALSGLVFRQLKLELPVTAVFQHPTIRRLGRFLEGLSHASASPIEPREALDFYPLSAAQKRLYILQTMEESRTSYNMFQAVVLTGEVEPERLETVFRRLLSRHHSLRTSFVLKDRQPVQRVHRSRELEFQIQQLPLPGRRLEEVIDSFIQPFDLASAPLVRVGLVALAPNRRLLMLDIHHIVCDARSIDVLVEEFAALMREEELAQPRLQYTDFALRELRLLETGGMRDAEEYWLRQFSGDIPLLNLPLAFPRQSRQSFAYDKVESALSMEATEAANQLRSRATEPVTMFMLLLAVYAVTLSKYSGQEDIVIGSGVSGRNHPDCARMMGMFVNMLALRSRPDARLSFMEYLLQVRRTVLGAFDHQDFPFDELVKRLDIKRQYGRNPLFDAEFTFQEEDALELDVPGLSIEPFDYQHQLMKFDLSLTAFESRGRLRLIFGYCPELFNRSFIEEFDGRFKEILARAARDPGAAIGALDVPRNLAGGESRFDEQDYMDFSF